MKRRRAGGLVAVVLLGGLVCTVGASAAVGSVQERHTGELMNRYASDAERAVETRTDGYENVLDDLARAVGAQSDMSADDFAAITSQLSRQRLPGATGVSFIVPARESQVTEVQRYWREKGASDLVLAPVAGAEEHLFGVLSRRLDGTSSISGRDLSQAVEPTEALRAARAGGQVSASRTYVLLRDRALPAAEQQLSFVLAAPVKGGLGTPDEGVFRGWVMMGMRGGDFMTEALRNTARGAIHVTLVDASVASSPRVVADSGTAPAGGDRSLRRERAVVVGGRQWQLRILPTGSLLSGADRHMTTWIGVGGVLITILLTALVAVLTNARRRALLQVEEATVALRADVAVRRETEARLRERDGELRHMAFHDPLTGLANRALFYQHAELAIARQNRYRDAMAVLYIDLDGFKQINDRLGHDAGDTVLKEVAARLKRCLRTSDTSARLGGDEFAVLAEQLTNPDDVNVVAGRIVESVGKPIEVRGESVVVTASVGVVLRQPGSTEVDDIIRFADRAMYGAKAAGKARYLVADPVMYPTAV
jgi:diguanylate cyclase (GGDEF)-like protein